MRLILAILLFASSCATGQGIPFVQYKLNHQSLYSLRTEWYRDDQLVSKSKALVELRVVSDSGILNERVTWKEKQLTFPDSVRMASVSEQVIPYNVSLHPGGQLNLPEYVPPEMRAEVNDLHYFFLAVSPALHISSLSSRRLSFMDSLIQVDHEKTPEGSFRACWQVNQRLLVRDRNFYIVQTSFLPPTSPCFADLPFAAGGPVRHENYREEWLEKNGRLAGIWGYSERKIISTIDARTGRLLKAELTESIQATYLPSGTSSANSQSQSVDRKRIVVLEPVK